jgi:hypothetical protein
MRCQPATREVARSSKRSSCPSQRESAEGQHRTAGLSQTRLVHRRLVVGRCGRDRPQTHASTAHNRSSHRVLPDSSISSPGQHMQSSRSHRTKQESSQSTLARPYPPWNRSSHRSSRSAGCSHPNLDRETGGRTDRKTGGRTRDFDGSGRLSTTGDDATLLHPLLQPGIAPSQVPANRREGNLDAILCHVRWPQNDVLT